ncbi:MAG: TIGR03118 family protein, partial [Alphaproteobacteria bacterium]|nr:TIGR03118 family protein [Alphaproteobacteria bacterium]
MRAHIGFAIALSLLVSPAMAVGYKIVPQISDQPGVAPVQDPDLVNPWGLAQLNDGAPVWTADNGTDKSTFYDRTSGAKNSTVVAISPGAPTGVAAAPSGVNFNVTANGLTGRCYFFFDTETGVIPCWAPSVDNFNAIIGYDGRAQGAVY